MKPALSKANLLTDLDAAGHKIINLPPDQPLPPATVADGSITDVKINASAAIQQSKLDLTGSIPPSFVGTTSSTAAQGDLAEYVAHRAQPNGYASLDSGGKIPTSQLPASAGVGTVTSVSVVTANGVSGTVATATTTPAITLSLASISPTAIAVSGTAGAGFVTFATQTSDPTGYSVLKLWGDTAGFLSFAHVLGTNNHIVKFLAPGLSATRAYTLPDKNGIVQMDSDIPTTMVGVGGSHKGGLVIDTGPSGTGTDYLARDATWKSPAIFSAPSYQPILPSIIFFPTTNTTGPRQITLGNSGTGGNVFYQIDSSAGPFIPKPATAISLAPLSTIYAYQAGAGFTNSAIVSYTNPNTV